MVYLPARLMVAAATMVVNSILAATTTGVVNVEIVEDLNFTDLADAVQGHPFLVVAFYSPGCGHCRRLLPSWTQAAQLIEDQRLPIRLARMDVSSRGGMNAWKAFGLKRLPTVKVFVGNNPDEPLPYAGHLDANGIAAHLAMLERARRLIKEIRKAAPILALRDPPTKVILVDFQNASGGGGDDGSRGTAVLHEDGSRRRQGSSRSGDPALPAGTEDILAKRQLAADIGVTFGEGPELRIFLDGRLWVEGGVFRGLPTTDGILQHMDWVADEAGLLPQHERATMKATQGGGRSTFDGHQIMATPVATADSLVNVSSEACPASSRCTNHAGGVTCQDED
ncbi:protein disulfide isomerase [Ectocarpus siliculosus]|uniref:Protein disulfide isomerase n=1 Tax=Ectocarpus siliculosus TaxID=2880 RepID=D7G0H6_ECTSI|nr:protein disulfide isomerase [Ectocarpus siliculosus]|eukprot:CBJ33005.1 protein disulfide isomerase [Ectocarpus siliculosus]